MARSFEEMSYFEQMSEVWLRLGKTLQAQANATQEVSLINSRNVLVLDLNVLLDGVRISAVGEYTVGGACRVECAAAAPYRFELGLSPWDYGSIFSKMFGAQDLELGDEGFDKNFIVKSNSPYLARLWVDKPLQQMMLDAHPFSLLFAKYKIEARLEISLSDDIPKRFTALFHSMATLANRGRALLSTWEQTATECGGSLSSQGDFLSLDEKTYFSVEVRGVRMKVEARYKEAGLLSQEKLSTIISAERLSTLGGVYQLETTLNKTDAHFGDGIERYYRVQPQNTEELQEALASNIASKIASHSHFTIQATESQLILTLPHIELSQDVLKNCIDLCALLAGNREQQPYR